MNERKCPDCEEKLLFSPVACECGWKKTQNRSQQCAYQFESQRCPLTGYLTNSLSRTAPLYCSYHIQHEVFPEQAQAALQEMLVDLESFWKKHLESRRPWQQLKQAEGQKNAKDNTSAEPFDYTQALQAFLNRYKS